MTEYHEKELMSIHLEGLELICKANSQKQMVLLYNHPILGKVLIINDEIQHIEKYQSLYHEQLVHLPMCFTNDPKSVLILGGGSLFAAYEVLKYPSIQSVTLCDHDPEVLKIMEKYYSHAQNVMKDNRFHYVNRDGIEFLHDCTYKYDIIINDCFNLLKENVKYPIYERLFSLLSPTGICSDVIYRHIFDGNITKQSIQEINKRGNLALSLVLVPEYPGVLHIQTIFGKNTNISQKASTTINSFQKKIINDEEDLIYQLFNPAFLPFYLYLPPYIRQIIE